MTVWDDTIVRLEPAELMAAIVDGGRRYTATRQANDRGGVKGDDLLRHVTGAAGEIAVAKWTGRYWSGIQGRAAPDVDGIEVRTRRGDPRDETTHLLIQPYDEEHHPETPFVFVVGDAFEYRLAGWMTPRQARRRADDPNDAGAAVRDFGDRGHACIAVTQQALWPVDHLRA